MVCARVVVVIIVVAVVDVVFVVIVVTVVVPFLFFFWILLNRDTSNIIYLVHCSQLLSFSLDCFYKTKPRVNHKIHKQHPDEMLQRSIEEELQLSQAVNETSGNGSRSQVQVNLRAICPKLYRGTSPPSNPCVRGWYYCPTYNKYEA